ncbi:MFS transporter [Methylobacterium sp. D53M]|jgi:MFS family permease
MDRLSLAAVPGRAPTAARVTSSTRVFWITWAGWMLDGFDSAIYIFVLVPAVSDLLAAGGIEPARGTIALYGGYFFSIFMLGWACSMFWGWLADRIGRVKVMCLTILVYSVFTGLCGLAGGLASFAVFRFCAGFGVGGEWAAGTPLLHESVSEHQRVRLAGWLHTATPTGLLLGAAASFLAPVIGWRGMFFLGVLPALLVVAIRATVQEPPQTRQARTKPGADQPSLADMFVGSQARTTWAAGLMMSCIILGLWSSTYWAPTLVISKLVATGSTPAAAQKVAAISGIITNIGTLIGCLAMPFIATWFGSRRRTAAAFFLGAFTINLVAYLGAAVWLDSVTLFIALLPLVGFFTNAVFALYTIWLPELFPTRRRAFGSGFAFSFGRILGALGPTIVGSLVVVTGSYPEALAIISLIYLIGLPTIWLAPETANKALLV